jgi:hypothetical protein
MADLAGLLLTIYDQNCKILKRISRLEKHVFNDTKVVKQELKNSHQELYTNQREFDKKKEDFDVKQEEFTKIKKEFDVKQEELNKKKEGMIQNSHTIGQQTKISEKRKIKDLNKK